MSIASALLVGHQELFVMFCLTSFQALWGVTSSLDAIRCRYQPDGRRNVVSLDDSSSSSILFWPSAMFMVAKHAADAGMRGLLFSVMLCVSRLMCLLSGGRYMTRSMLLPGFGTKNVWQHHVFGSATLFMLPLLMSSALWAFALAWYPNGICLVVDTLYGFNLV